MKQIKNPKNCELISKLFYFLNLDGHPPKITNYLRELELPPKQSQPLKRKKPKQQILKNLTICVTQQILKVF